MFERPRESAPELPRPASEVLLKIAWFSPLPPSQSGIAAYSADLLPLLRTRHTIDAFVEETPSGDRPGTFSAHEFVWRARRAPYDLVVYQLGNASCHDYMWGYLFRYPGLVVLHDAQLHQARALSLTRRWQPRLDDYLEEFRANHPSVAEDVGYLVAAGLGGTLYHHWPLLKLVLEAARLTAVHNQRLKAELSAMYSRAAIEVVEMGVGEPAPRAEDGALVTASDVRRRHAIPENAVVVAAFGGVTPEKRIPVLIEAVAALAETQPHVHVLLVGGVADYYDAEADARAHGIAERVHLAGFVPDRELPAYLAASDVCACLRWPSNRETSASWLRCLAAGRCTVVSDLAHLADVPTLDPRDWRVLSAASGPGRSPVAVSIDVLDEQHSLTLALDRLASDRTLRSRLGKAGRAWWHDHHRLDQMVEAYGRLLDRARATPPSTVALPRHLMEDGTSQARALLTPFGAACEQRAADLWADDR